MPYTYAKTNWVDNEIVIPDDFNRLEANIDAAAKTNYEQVVYGGVYTMGSGLSGFYEPAMNVAHTSRTGRVKITLTLTLQNTSGAARTPYVSLARDGINLLRNKPNGLARATIASGTFYTFYISYISGDAPIGVGVEYNLMVKEATGAINLYSSTLIVEDI